MADAFVQSIAEKIDTHVDREILIFKIIMEIHFCHEKIKQGVWREDKQCESLMKYYESLAGNPTPTTHKMDILYFDVWNIPQVYSVEFDETFPLMAYPYKLFCKYQNLAELSAEEIDILRPIKEHPAPTDTREYARINARLKLLTRDTKNTMKIYDFLE